MKVLKSFFILLLFYQLNIQFIFAEGLESRTVTLSSNERFELVQANSVKFKFQPLSDEARKLEITNDASALGVAYLGQIRLKENFTPLSALRSIADQIGKSLNINFGVIADSNVSEALKTNELLLLYHPNVTITLALARPNEESDYEIICTYALKDVSIKQTNETGDLQATQTNPQSIQQKALPKTKPENDIAPVKDLSESTEN